MERSRAAVAGATITMQFKDYYDILGVEPSAGDAEIKTAYRRLARKYHPDVSKEAGAEEQFKAVNEAYEALRSEEHTSELQSLMRISYAVFCLKKKHTINKKHKRINTQKPATDQQRDH